MQSFASSYTHLTRQIRWNLFAAENPAHRRQAIAATSPGMRSRSPAVSVDMFLFGRVEDAEALAAQGVREAEGCAVRWRRVSENGEGGGGGALPHDATDDVLDRHVP